MENYERIMRTALQGELSRLLGYTVKEVQTSLEHPPENSEDIWPVLIFERDGSPEIRVEVSCDPEGNGPGWLFIEEVQS